MKKVLVTHRLPGNRIHDLHTCCNEVVWSDSGLMSAFTLQEELADCQGLICMLTDRLSADVLACAPQLEFVSSMSVGVDHVDVPALTARGIPLGNTPGVLVDTTADLAFALLLAAARRVPEADSFVRQGNWNEHNAWSPEFFTGKDVSGATLGLIGLGAISEAVARRAAGFGMNVLAWNRTPRDVANVVSVSLDEVLSRSDFVSVHVALAPDTRNLISADRIAQMKPGAVLVNTARGGIVDEVALADALRSRHLYAAGVDVFDREPITAENPLLELSNVVLAPHVGSATQLTRARMADLAVENALAAIAGQPMPHCVNPEVYTK
ncbi:MAG: D-glycerate dehydrogenase [Halioglobus sp.]